jgi:hypothetical protein
MYQLSGDAFDEQFRIKSVNIRRSILEEMLRDPSNDPEATLDTNARLLVIAQRQIANDAQLTSDQIDDFEHRMDNLIAEAVLTIKDCIEQFTDWRSAACQIECARRLEVPVE